MGNAANEGIDIMSSIIAVVLAILAIFILVKVAGFIFKLLAVLLLAGAAIAAFVVIRGKLGGPR
jgi:hypothetical protein